MEVNKFESCYGCPDRCIEPVNCHTTCEGYLYRQKKAQVAKEQRAADKDFNNFKKTVVRETKAKIGK